MKVYVITFKDTTIDEDNVMNVESGICEIGYHNEQDAISQLTELADRQKEMCIDELGYDESDIEIEYNDKGDYVTVNCGSNTYEYLVDSVEVC